MSEYNPGLEFFKNEEKDLKWYTENAQDRTIAAVAMPVMPNT